MRSSGIHRPGGNHLHLDTELLSAYIDGEVTPDEASRVEEHLPSCSRCAEELESLRWTVNLLREVPPVPIPRSFVVRAADLQPEAGRRRFTRPNWLFRGLQWATVATAALLLLVVAADFLNFGQAPAPMLMQAAQSERRGPQVAGEADESEVAEQTVPVLVTVQVEREEVAELLSGPKEVPAPTNAPELPALTLRKQQPGEEGAEAVREAAPPATQQPQAPPVAAKVQEQATEVVTESVPVVEQVKQAPGARQSFTWFRSAEIGLSGLLVLLLGLTLWARRRLG